MKQIDFNQDEHIFLRGIPLKREEVHMQQERLDAQPFDESLFNDLAKKIACAQIIRALDFSYHQIVQQRGFPLGENEIMQVDIGDAGWVYIPVLIIPPDSNVIVMPTKDRPTSELIAWFRRKKIYTTGGYQHVGKTNPRRLH